LKLVGKWEIQCLIFIFLQNNNSLIFTLSTDIFLNAAWRILKFWIYSCSRLVLNLILFMTTLPVKKNVQTLNVKHENYLFFMFTFPFTFLMYYFFLVTINILALYRAISNSILKEMSDFKF
jgi:hypothetical protein